MLIWSVDIIELDLIIERLYLVIFFRKIPILNLATKENPQMQEYLWFNAAYKHNYIKINILNINTKEFALLLLKFYGDGLFLL